jgi:hypothetical protein
MLYKRTKPLNIRVSEEEFQKLHEACNQIGVRNVSELAREAMRLTVDEHRSALLRDQDPIVWLDELGGRLVNLLAEVERLKTLLKSNSK